MSSTQTVTAATEAGPSVARLPSLARRSYAAHPPPPLALVQSHNPTTNTRHAFSPLPSGSSRASLPLALNITYPPRQVPTPASRQTPRTPVSAMFGRRKRRRLNMRLVQSILYQTSFSLFVLIIGVLAVGTVWGLGQEALRSGGQRRWNIVIIVSSYIILALIAVAVVWSRLFSIRKILRTMPKPYMPTKQMDVPHKVADHIQTEYSRTAVIAHISQATKGQQEGWGRPGTKWENQHFRTCILSTLPDMRAALAPKSTAPAHVLWPLSDAAAEQGDEKGAFRAFVQTYVEMIEKARYSRREPTESEAGACEKLVNVILLTLELRKRRRNEGTVT